MGRTRSRGMLLALIASALCAVAPPAEARETGATIVMVSPDVDSAVANFGMIKDVAAALPTYQVRYVAQDHGSAVALSLRSTRTSVAIVTRYERLRADSMPTPVLRSIVNRSALARSRHVRLSPYVHYRMQGRPAYARAWRPAKRLQV